MPCFSNFTFDMILFVPYFTDIICCKQKRKLHKYGNTKLAIMPTLPTLYEVEQLDLENEISLRHTSLLSDFDK